MWELQWPETHEASIAVFREMQFKKHRYRPRSPEDGHVKIYKKKKKNAGEGVEILG